MSNRTVSNQRNFNRINEKTLFSSTLTRRRCGVGKGAENTGPENAELKILIGGSVAKPLLNRPPCLLSLNFVDRGTTPALEGSFFQRDQSSGHAMRLNSGIGTEGSPASSLDCDRSLRSGIRAPKL